MSQHLVAKRYAKALFDQDQSGKNLDALKRVKELFDLEESRRILNSPVMPTDLKADLLNYALKGATSDDSLKNFMTELTRSGRLTVFPEVFDAYQSLLNAKTGTMVADMTTAVPVDDQTKSSYEKSLSKAFGKSVRVVAHTDPNILGGAKVKLGNYVIDMSLESKLKTLATHQ